MYIIKHINLIKEPPLLFINLRSLTIARTSPHSLMCDPSSDRR